LKLMLDEHYAPAIASQLRGRGHDVVAVKERPDLVSLGDDELLRRMLAEGRAIVTENVSDFLPLVGRWNAAEEDHAGLVLTSSRSLPRNTATIGVFVRSLDALLRERSSDHACHNEVIWLIPRG
jgi:hypothetical protein